MLELKIMRVFETSLKKSATLENPIGELFGGSAERKSDREQVQK
jgi:hypothetical protein